MSLVATLIDQISTARCILEEGREVVPTWRIATPEGTYLILTHFDPNREGQRERALLLVSRFMVWKMATSFVLTAETWLGGGLMRRPEETLLAVGVSQHERLGLLQRITSRQPIKFAIDEAYFNRLPTKSSEITADEIAELSAIFGEGGEMQADRLS